MIMKYQITVKKKLNEIIKSKKKIITCFYGCPDLTPNYDNIIVNISGLFEYTPLSNDYKLVVRCIRVMIIAG